jgi:hypothetical protein
LLVDGNGGVALLFGILLDDVALPLDTPLDVVLALDILLDVALSLNALPDVALPLDTLLDADKGTLDILGADNWTLDILDANNWTLDTPDVDDSGIPDVLDADNGMPDIQPNDDSGVLDTLLDDGNGEVFAGNAKDIEAAFGLAFRDAVGTPEAPADADEKVMQNWPPVPMCPEPCWPFEIAGATSEWTACAKTGAGTDTFSFSGGVTRLLLSWLKTGCGG